MSAESESELLDLLASNARRHGGDHVVIHDAVRAVVEDNEALRGQIKGLRDAVGQAMPVIQAVWDELRRKIVPMWAVLEPYLADDAPMGTAWAEGAAAGYEQEARITGTCFHCGGGMDYRPASVPGESGRWVHRKQAADGHEAQPGVRA